MLRKHSITINGHATSFSLEDEFYLEIKKIAKSKKMSVSALITGVDHQRDPTQNLSSALRLRVLQELKANQSDR